MNPPRLLDHRPATPYCAPLGGAPGNVHRDAADAADPLAGLCTSLLEVLPVAIAVYGADGTPLRANPAFRALLDAAGGARDGTAPALAEVIANGGADLERAMVRARRGERVGPICIPFGRTQPRLLDATLLPLGLPDGATAVALTLSPAVGTSDGTAAESGIPWTAELDALLAEQARRARERRLAAVGQLAAGVMHDVNNALNPIVAAAYLLERNAGDPEAVRDYAQRIARAAETAAATAARVGRFIRQEPLAERSHGLVDLGALAEEVVQMTRPLWAERTSGGLVRLEFDCPEGVQVRGSAGELREAMLNLVQNALDAMQGSGGVLGMRIAALPHAIALEVHDTGAGMSSEVRERAFEPFFTTKGTQGTGLGLSEVWGVMKRHAGHAEIESAPGAGTTLRLVFPRPHATRRVTGERLVVGDARVPRRVLLVEDHDEGREFMRALLATEGHDVVAVTCATDARARLATPGMFDVLVTDLGLPDGAGGDLVREARLRWPALRVGVVTGWEPHALREALPAHFTLRKPLRVADLLACVGAPDA